MHHLLFLNIKHSYLAIKGILELGWSQLKSVSVPSYIFLCKISSYEFSRFMLLYTCSTVCFITVVGANTLHAVLSLSILCMCPSNLSCSSCITYSIALANRPFLNVSFLIQYLLIFLRSFSEISFPCIF